MLSRLSPPLLLSPEAALGWEYWKRFRRQLPLTLAAMCLLPLVVGLFRRGGEWLLWLRFSQWESSADLPPAFSLAAVTLQIAGALLVMLASAPLGRAYILPLTTRALFRNRLAHLSAAACVAMTLATSISNLVLGTHWPYVAPILFAVVAVLAAQWIAVDFRGREWWIGGAGAIVAIPLLLALRANFFDAEGQSWAEHPFDRFTLAEALVLGAAGFVFWRRTLLAAERDRCAAHNSAVLSGEAVIASYVPARPVRPFRFPWTAMLTCEWRRNGVLLPVAVGLATLVGFGAQLVLAIREFESSGGAGGTGVYAFQMEFSSMKSPLSMGLAVFAFGALLECATTSTGRRLLAGHRPESWPLSLPASNRKIGYVALARSLLSGLAGTVAWGLAGFFWIGAGQLYLRLSGADEVADAAWTQFKEQPAFGDAFWTILFVFAAIGWTLCGVVEASILSGRRWVALMPPVGLFALVLLMGAAQLLCVSDRLDHLLWMLAAIGALVALVVALWSRTLTLVGGGACFSVWISSAILLAFASHAGKNIPLTFGRFVSDYLTPNALLPLACLTLPNTLPPLAVAWNRSR